MKHQETILKLLPASKITIAKTTGVDRSTINRDVNKMAANGLIHIGQWLARGEGPASIAVYHAGPGKQARKPVALTRAEIEARRPRRTGRYLRTTENVPVCSVPTVQYAIQTQPNSVFAYRGMFA